MKSKIKNIVVVGVIVSLSVALCVCIPFMCYYAVMTSYSFNYTNDGTFAALPDEYKLKSEQPGKIVSIDYKTSTYYDEDAYVNNHNDAGSFESYKSKENVELTKTIYVYLPFGYDADGTTKYDVLYHIHGTTCDGTTLINGVGKESETKNVLDNMIQKEDMKPTIVVFPTWYNGLDLDESDPDYLIAHFQYEFVRDIIPAVEKEYRTYADITSSMTADELGEALKASRDHRGVSGYSRGASLTWYVFANNLDYFKWFNPMSGDYLCEFFTGTEESCLQKSRELEQRISDGGYGVDDFFVYSTVGALDFAYRGVHMQFNGMIQCPQTFKYGSTADKGNFYLSTAPGVWHTDTTAPMFFYNSLRVLFDN